MKKREYVCNFVYIFYVYVNVFVYNFVLYYYITFIILLPADRVKRAMLAGVHAEWKNQQERRTRPAIVPVG